MKADSCQCLCKFAGPQVTGGKASPSEMVKELCWPMLGSTMEMLMHLVCTSNHSSELSLPQSLSCTMRSQH